HGDRQPAGDSRLAVLRRLLAAVGDRQRVPGGHRRRPRGRAGRPRPGAARRDAALVGGRAAAGAAVGAPAPGRRGVNSNTPAAIGLPVGIGAGVFLAERGDGKLGHVVRFTAEVLASVPSIVIGVVAYGLICMPMHGNSALAGAFALAILMVPTLARSTEEMVR